MYNLYDFGMAISEIRDAADMLEVRGARNADLVSMIYRKCNDLIVEINRIAEQANNSEENEPQVGDEDGQIDS